MNDNTSTSNKSTCKMIYNVTFNHQFFIRQNENLEFHVISSITCISFLLKSTDIKTFYAVNNYTGAMIYTLLHNNVSK